MKFSTSVTLFAVALAATVSASTSESKQQHRGLVRRVRSNNNPIEERDDEHVPHYVNLQKRFGGQATFYNNAVSEGACGGYTSPGDKIVALNIAQYGNPGAVSKWCGQKILISYGGKSEVATVVDCCPSCAYGSLDMSKGLFGAFADFGAGVFQMSWKPLNGGDDGSSDSGSDSDSGQKQQKPSPKPKPKPSPTPKAKTTSSTSTSSSSTSTSSSSSSSSSSTSSSSSSSSSTIAPASTPASDSNLADLTNVYKGLLDMANAVGGH